MYKRLSVFLLLLFNFAISFAQVNCSTLDADIVSGEAPNPINFACVVGRVINVLVLCAGIAFAYMVLWGALKLSMAQGDPKGYAAAQNTWFYAFVGFLIVTGFFVVYLIIANILGLPVPTTGFITDGVADAIVGIMRAAKVCAPASGIPCVN